MKCNKAGCSWMIHAVAIDSSLDVFKIKKHVGRHTCGVGLKLRSPLLTKKLINHLIHDKVRHNPLIKTREIKDYLKYDVGVNVKYHSSYHGLELSHQKLFGNDVKLYTDLVWWVNTLKEINPGSHIDFDYNDADNRFEKLFISFGACIEGYKLCRPMIFVDVTFLTGPFKRGLMATTCLNGDQAYNLEKVVDGRPIKFFSDRHEGLLQYIPAVFPSSHHSYCYYHILNNLPIKKFDEKYNEVVACYKKGTYALTPARFGQTSSSVAESFNNWIRDEKKLLACPLVDTIRRRIMELMSKRREEILLMDPEKLTPTYQAFLEEHIQMGRVWNVSQYDHNIFEVHSPRSHFVDLDRMTCTCQRWRVYGFPCSHATAAISTYPNYDRPEEYTEEDTILPPNPRAPPGRPKGIRIKSARELSKKSVTCSKCHKKTHHNKATCTFIPPYP
ncbi:uncharacterized protein LOC113324284 [Papaver somniferum]|uniref:uncharacterized protein LOC113324284 n=1 Tax=Papaver somniferum TaxID=3469 RepID=UPI000E6FAD74|nr:uncharacterized protein LOC113324284 [Papaver somniferum]